MTDKQKEAAVTAAYLRGFETGQDAAKSRIAALEAEVLAGNDWLNARSVVLQELAEANARIAELEAALDNILSCHRNAMMDPRLFSALMPDYVLEEAYGVLKKKWMKETPE